MDGAPVADPRRDRGGSGRLGPGLSRERPLAARALELTGWGFAIAGMVVALAGPVWVEESGRTEPGRVVVLVDGSRSMGVIEDGQPRHEAVEGILDHVRRQADRVDVFHFGDDLAVGAPGSFDLPGTDVEGALYAMGERVAGERLAGVVVVTDGLDRGLLRKRFLDEGPDARGPDLPGPLTVYQVGARSDLRDLAVRSVESGGYALHPQPLRDPGRDPGRRVRRPDRPGLSGAERGTDSRPRKSSSVRMVGPRSTSR